jgi:hypothetical protein
VSSPFKQVPVIDDDGYILAESGAFLRIASIARIENIIAQM